MEHRRLGLLALLLVVSSTLAAPALGDGGSGSRTLTLVSGNATAPGRDPFTKFSLDGGSTWKEAYVVPKCGSPGPWDASACLAWATPIPGTEWIAVSSDKSGPATSLYRRKFKLPKRCRSATLEIDVHADNDVTISLNGIVFGAQPAGAHLPNFQGPPERFSTDGPFHRRWNALGFRVRDYGNPTALDYKATVTCSGEKRGAG
jgi:hypothetical protein